MLYSINSLIKGKNNNYTHAILISQLWIARWKFLLNLI